MNVKMENQGNFLFFRCFEKMKMVPFSRFYFQYYIKKRMNATYTDLPPTPFLILSKRIDNADLFSQASLFIFTKGVNNSDYDCIYAKFVHDFTFLIRVCECVLPHNHICFLICDL